MQAGIFTTGQSIATKPILLSTVSFTWLANYYCNPPSFITAAYEFLINRILVSKITVVISGYLLDEAECVGSNAEVILLYY